MSSEDDIQYVYESKKPKSNVKSRNYFKEERFKSKKNESESDSDQKSSEQTPNGAECLKRCKEFAERTGTDTALAMFYLQETNWNLEKGLNAYFDATDNKSSKIVACFDVEKLDDDEDRQRGKSPSKKAKSSREESPDQTVSVDVNDETETKKGTLMEKGKYFKILSWNIDGLDATSIEARTIGVVNKVKKEEPDVVLLQEVVELTEDILRDNLSDKYEFFSGKLYTEYYTMILVSKKTCTASSNQLIDFENSVMGRNLLKVKFTYKKLVDVCVMTSHLESTADFSKQRIEQLRKCFKEIESQNENSLVFFGGDLNLRDKDLEAIGGLPKGINDVWLATGKRKECEYTWDMSRNTNLRWAAKYKPRCRFDRLFYRPKISKQQSQVVNDQECTLMPVYFELEGLEKLKSCGKFCSDHWAIQAYCQIESM